MNRFQVKEWYSEPPNYFFIIDTTQEGAEAYMHDKPFLNRSEAESWCNILNSANDAIEKATNEQ